MKIVSKLFKGASGRFAGLDIGAYSAKSVILSRRGKELEIVDFALERVAGGAGAPTVGKIVSRLGISGENLATAISGQQVVIRHIGMPKMTEEELRASIKYDTDIHFPFKLEDAVIDFHIPESAKELGEMEVCMVAARKEVVESHLKLLGAANIVPRQISVDAVALVNACDKAIDTKDRCVALVNVGARKTIIVMIHNQRFSFTRETEIGCAKLSSAISKGLSVSGDEGDRIVREKIGDHDVYLSSFVTDVAREVKSSINYFEERNGLKIDDVYIDGGGSMIEGLDKRLSDEIGQAVGRLDVMGEAMSGLEPGKREELEGLAPLFTIAYGLASGLSAAP